MNDQSYEQLMQQLITEQEEQSITQEETRLVEDKVEQSELPTSIEQIRQGLTEKMTTLVASQQVQEVAKTINLETSEFTEQILEIGGEVMLRLDEVSSVLIENIKKAPLEDSDTLITKLQKIMDKVNIEKILDDAQKIKEQPTTPDKLSKFAKKIVGATGIEGILRKYDTLSHDFDLITTSYTKIINELNESNLTLGAQIKAAETFYHQMDLHIAVLYALKERITLVEIPQRQKALQQTGEVLIEHELQTLFLALQLTDQRLTDLMISQQAIFQSIPMIKNSILCNIQLTNGFKAALQAVPALKSNIISAIEINRSVIAAQTLTRAQQMRDRQLEMMGIATLKQAELTIKTLNSHTNTVQVLEVSAKKVNEAQKILGEGIKQSFTFNETARTQMLHTRAELITNHPTNTKV